MTTEGFHGMTINSMMERMDLLNFTFDDDDNNTKHKEEITFTPTNAAVMNPHDPTSAYLGPKLWNTLISHENLEDSDEGGEAVAMSDIFYTVRREGSSPGPSSPTADEVEVKPHIRPSIIVPKTKRRDTEKSEPNLQSGANKFLYVESKRARVDREKMERKRKLEVQHDFAPEDIALATVPGLEFDPKTRAFDMEELRPQPIIKKRKKSSVPEDLKDEKYWEKRNKNKEATRRSREAKRLKENQIVLRAAYLERENKVLKQELNTTNFEKSKLKTEIDILKSKLHKYESIIDI